MTKQPDLREHWLSANDGKFWKRWSKHCLCRFLSDHYALAGGFLTVIVRIIEAKII